MSERGFSKDTGRTEGEVGEENMGQGRDPRKAAVWGGQQHGENSPDSETTIRRREGNHLCQEKARRHPGPGLTTEPLDLCTQATVPFTFLQEQSDWEKKAGCKVPGEKVGRFRGQRA